MNEIEKRVVGTATITMEARLYDGLVSVTEGVRTAKYIDDKVKEAEEEKARREANQKEYNTPIVTPEEIIEEMYRD